MRLCCRLSSEIVFEGYSAYHVSRYLRARKFVPQEAFTQFKDTEDWRKTNQLEELYESIDVDEYEQTRRLVCSNLSVPLECF